MYNIVVSDRLTRIIDKIITNTDWHIKLLVVNDGLKEKYTNNTRIENVITLSELMSCDVKFDCEFREIGKYLSFFHTADYGSRRINNDIYFSHYTFYKACAFWITYFKNNKIDFCINRDLLHGLSCDYILEEVAMSYGVDTYHVVDHFFQKVALFSKKSDKFIENRQASDNDVKSIASYSTRINYDLKSTNEGLSIARKVKKQISDFIYKTFGAAGIEMVRFIMHGSHRILFSVVNLKNYWDVCRHIIKIFKYIKTLYVELNYDQNFVVYFLHFEPEAVVTNYSGYIDNQLFYVRLLAQSLPDGWILYVKEHPDTYKINTRRFAYQIPAMGTFLTKYFYDELVSIKNVYLVDHRIPASDLIKKAKAISTIAGTVITEAILNHVPVIMFAGSRHIYSQDKDIFHPQSSRDIEQILSKIANGEDKTLPDCNNIQKLFDKYVFESDDQGISEIIEAIKKDFEKHKNL